MKKIILPTIWPVACHTDNIGPNSTFVAIKGDSLDGTKFITKAKAQGATKVITEDARRSLSNLSSQAWGNPAKELKIIGITGTKGKTTSVYALHHILAQAGKKVAMITGVENMICNQKFVANLTTPQPDYLHMFFAQCVQAGIEYVVMEVSAQALSLHRVDDIEFCGIIFTNLEQEHAEFYSSINNYFTAKCRLFDFLGPDAFVVLNQDDSWVSKTLNDDRLAGKKVITFGSGIGSDYKLKIKQSGLVGLDFSLTSLEGNFACTTNKVFGYFNAYNLAGATLCAKQFGLSDVQIKQALATFVSAPGRLEIYTLPNGACGVVDYAHTPNSFKNVLSLLRTQTKHLIVIFGAGGGKDDQKRSVMGKIATEFCDTVILTNDNPRHEDTGKIVKQIIGSNLSNEFLIELDRAKAIKWAYSLSSKNSIIVLLGKGPDEYQIIADQKTFFSDREQLLNLQF
jgi:UDP-N-acetylmuramoyl-L-alanyl-D-glutamate--2,6-diaminopimelate ligase